MDAPNATTISQNSCSVSLMPSINVETRNSEEIYEIFNNSIINIAPSPNYPENATNILIDDEDVYPEKQIEKVNDLVLLARDNAASLMQINGNFINMKPLNKARNRCCRIKFILGNAVTEEDGEIRVFLRNKARRPIFLAEDFINFAKCSCYAIHRQSAFCVTVNGEEYVNWERTIDNNHTVNIRFYRKEDLQILFVPLVVSWSLPKDMKSGLELVFQLIRGRTILEQIYHLKVSKNPIRDMEKWDKKAEAEEETSGEVSQEAFGQTPEKKYDIYQVSVSKNDEEKTERIFKSLDLDYTRQYF